MDIATIIGDIIFNIRCALDYIAHELVKRNGFTPTNQTQFPICGTVKDFDNEALGKSRLAGISLCAYWIIDAFQPYQVQRIKYDQHPLWRLHKLSNFDKHRTLALSALGMKCIAIFIGGNGRVRTTTSDRMLHDRDVAIRLPTGFNPRETQVQIRMTCQVSFQDAPVVDCEVSGTLQTIREFVGKHILPAVEPFFDPLPNELVLTSHGITPELLATRPPLTTMPSIMVKRGGRLVPLN